MPNIWTILYFVSLTGCFLAGFTYRHDVAGYRSGFPAFVVFGGAIICVTITASNMFQAGHPQIDVFFLVIASFLGGALLVVIGWMLGGANAQH